MGSKQKVKLFHYQSDLESGSGWGSISAAKHWAVVVEYFREGGTKPEETILYEAGMDEKGFLQASQTNLIERRRKERMSKPGAKMDELEGTFQMDYTDAENFIKTFNEDKIRYSAVDNNCQKFVQEFLANSIIDACLPALPTMAERAFQGVKAFSTASVASMTNASSMPVIRDIILKRAIPSKGLLTSFVRQALENASVKGVGKFSILAESPLKEYMKETGQQLILSAYGEMTEAMMNALRGGFTWWQLLQIPVEVITKVIVEKGFDKDKITAYGWSKVASLFTAAGVGVAFGGPVGLMASVALWIASEVASYLVRKVVDYFWPGWLGESKTEALVKNIYEFLKTASIAPMMRYIGMDPDFGQKKLE